MPFFGSPTIWPVMANAGELRCHMIGCAIQRTFLADSMAQHFCGQRACQPACISIATHGVIQQPAGQSASKRIFRRKFCNDARPCRSATAKQCGGN